MTIISIHRDSEGGYTLSEVGVGEVEGTTWTPLIAGLTLVDLARLKDTIEQELAAPVYES